VRLTSAVLLVPGSQLGPGAIDPVGDEGGATRVAIFVGTPVRPLDGQPPRIVTCHDRGRVSLAKQWVIGAETD